MMPMPSMAPRRASPLASFPRRSGSRNAWAKRQRAYPVRPTATNARRTRLCSAMARIAPRVSVVAPRPKKAACTQGSRSPRRPRRGPPNRNGRASRSSGRVPPAARRPPQCASAQGPRCFASSPCSTAFQQPNDGLPKGWNSKAYTSFRCGQGFGGLANRSRIHPVTRSRTAGAMVSSIVAYSVGLPVLAVWNR
jgi:hypothetical protein